MRRIRRRESVLALRVHDAARRELLPRAGAVRRAPHGHCLCLALRCGSTGSEQEAAAVWEERSLPTGLANIEVEFANDSHGLLLAAGTPATQCQTQTVTMWRTTDGAGTWQQLAPSGIVDAKCKHGLAPADATHAFFTASTPTDPAVIYRTADGGSSWQSSTPLSAPPGDTTVFAMPSRPKAFGSVVLVDA